MKIIKNYKQDASLDFISQYLSAYPNMRMTDFVLIGLIKSEIDFIKSTGNGDLILTGDNGKTYYNVPAAQIGKRISSQSPRWFKVGTEGAGLNNAVLAIMNRLEKGGAIMTATKECPVLRNRVGTKDKFLRIDEGLLKNVK